MAFVGSVDSSSFNGICSLGQENGFYWIVLCFLKNMDCKKLPEHKPNNQEAALQKPAK